MDFDAVIVGGGPAGLSAALTLSRAGRRTVLFDADDPRNAPAYHAHGLLTRDGVPPETLRTLGREDVLRYGTEIRTVRVAEVVKISGGFRVQTARGRSVETRTLVLATGVVDELPDLPGLAEAWGTSAIHCPYCHGYEWRDRPTAVLGRGDGTYAQARLLRGWTSDLTVLTNGPENLDTSQEHSLSGMGIKVDRRPIARLRCDGKRLVAVQFTDGDETPFDVLYLRPPQRQAAPFAEQLGVPCNGPHAQADEDGRTSVTGLFVAGDAVNTVQNVAMAIASGVRAGMAANYDLVCGPPR
ncbi:MAG: NAD(P)/FAD-dependent oxidoreductase [Rubricoccaceae bacterium]